MLCFFPSCFLHGSHDESLLVPVQDIHCHSSGPWLCILFFIANFEPNSSSGEILLRLSSKATSSLKPSLFLSQQNSLLCGPWRLVMPLMQQVGGCIIISWLWSSRSTECFWATHVFPSPFAYSPSSFAQNGTLWHVPTLAYSVGHVSQCHPKWSWGFNTDPIGRYIIPTCFGRC